MAVTLKLLLSSQPEDAGAQTREAISVLAGWRRMYLECVNGHQRTVDAPVDHVWTVNAGCFCGNWLHLTRTEWRD